MNVVFISFIPILITTVFAFDPNYGFEIQTYNISFDIKSDRSMHVIEDIEIKYLGKFSTGIIRNIPLQSGDRIKHVDVKLKEGDKLLNYSYDVELNTYLKELLLTITDHVRKQNRTQTLHISYDFYITKPREKNAIFLNVIGFDWDANIKHSNVFLQLPDGYKKSDFFIGKTDIPSNDKYIYNNKKRTLTASVNNLSYHNGLTFNLYFNNGILSTNREFTPFFIVIIFLPILPIFFLIQNKFFQRKKINPIMNLNIAKYMDPLFMCRAINKNVSSFDITSLIYYWANENFVSITYIEKDDCLITKKCSELPENVPMYQKMMFNSLFQNGDEIKVNSLNHHFYETINNVVYYVNKTNIQKYVIKSLVVSFIFEAISWTIIVFLPHYLCKMNISSKISYFNRFFVFVPAILICYITDDILYIENGNFILVSGMIMNLIALLFYISYIPDVIMDYLSKILLCLFWLLTTLISNSVICPTDQYVQLLNQIIGLIDFINNIAKKDLEVLMKDNPQLFFNILPYAQVLDMNEIWENKFDGLIINQPLSLIIPENTYFEPINYDFNYEEQSSIYNYWLWKNLIDESRTLMNQCFNSLPTPVICASNKSNDDHCYDYNNNSNNHVYESQSDHCSFSGGFSGGGGHGI